jgi:hypothetical protein
MLLADGGGLTSRPKKATVSAPASPLKKPSDSITGKKYSSSSSSSGSANAAEYRAEKQRAAAKRASDYAASQRPQSRPASKPSGEGLRAAEHRTEAAARRARDYAASQRPQSRPASKPFEGSVRAAEHRADEKRAAAERARDYAASQRPQSRPASKPFEGSVRAAEHRADEKRAATERARDYAASQRPQSRPTSKPFEGSVRAAEHQADEKRAAAKRASDYAASQRPQSRPTSKPFEGSAKKREESKGWFEKALDATKEVAEDAWENKGEIGHGILDVVGVIDPTGIADGINAGWYLAEGDGVNAALSAAGMIPYVGDLAKVGKYGVKAAKAGEEAVKAANKADTAKTYITYTFRDGENVRYAGRASGVGTPEQVLAQRISKGHRVAKDYPKLTTKIEGVQGSSSANKGAEDVLYSYHQTRGDKVVNGKKVNGGASDGNQPLLNRTNPLSNIARKASTIGRKHIENYAKDLRGVEP